MVHPPGGEPPHGGSPGTEGPSLRLLCLLTERLLQDLLTRVLLFMTLIQHSSLIVGDHYQGKAGQGNYWMGSFCRVICKPRMDMVIRQIRVPISK